MFVDTGPFPLPLETINYLTGNPSGCNGLSGLAQFRTVLIVLTVLTGALGSARLQLGSHSLAQVGAGAAAGVAVTAATVLLI